MLFYWRKQKLAIALTRENKKDKVIITYQTNKETLSLEGYTVKSYNPRLQKEQIEEAVDVIETLLAYYLTREKPHERLAFVYEVFENTQAVLPLFNYNLAKTVIEKSNEYTLRGTLQPQSTATQEVMHALDKDIYNFKEKVQRIKKMIAVA